MVLATIQSFFTTLKSPSQEFFFLDEGVGVRAFRSFFKCVEDKWKGRERLTAMLGPESEENDLSLSVSGFRNSGFAVDELLAEHPAGH